MFKSRRFQTQGIENELPIEIQLFLCDCIDALIQNGYKADYLQVFKLEEVKESGLTFQKITHSQEMPIYEKCYQLC